MRTKNKNKHKLTHIFLPFSILANIQRIRINKTAAVWKASFADELRELPSLDCGFEIDQCLIRIDAHAVSWETSVHDIKEELGMCAVCGDEEEVVG